MLRTGSADILRVKVNPLILSLRSATTLAVMSVLLACTGLAQTLSVVSGNAQVTPQNNSTVNPLVVVAKDSAGRPVQGVSVTWTITGPGHLTPFYQTTTDVNGLTSVYFVGDFQWDGPGFAQSTIVASAASSSVSMLVTTSGVNFASGAEFVRADVLTPVLGDVLTTPGPGESAPFVEVRVTANGNQGAQVVPNVGIRLIPDHPDGPSLACAEGTGLTGANGIAHCVVVFSGTIGSDRFSIEVGGGFRTFGPFHFAVTQAQTLTTVIRITGGNNQAALPGVMLPAPLTARVEDSAGHALPGVGVTWQPVVAQTVVLSSVVSTSDSNGIVSALATLGSTVGSVQVRVRTTSGAEAIFNLTVRQPASTGPAPARLHILSGNNQSGTVGTRLTDTLTARVEDAAGTRITERAGHLAAVAFRVVDKRGVDIGFDRRGFRDRDADLLYRARAGGTAGHGRGADPFRLCRCHDIGDIQYDGRLRIDSSADRRVGTASGVAHFERQ